MTPEVNFACSVCGNGIVLPLEPAGAHVFCSRCGQRAQLAYADDPGMRRRCAACGCETLYVQRDFNRLLGLAIVAVAALFAVPTFGLSLLAAAVLDLMLYRLLPRITICYACDAVHRGVPPNPQHAAYDHHVEDGFKVEKSKRQVAAQEWRRAHGA